MDLRLRRLWLLGLVLIAGLLAVPSVASATHFRSANINWERAGATTENVTPVRFNVVLSYKWSNFSQPAVGHERTYESFDMGDGTFVSPTFRVTFVNQGEDYFIAEAIAAPGSAQKGFVHNYTGPGPFNAGFNSCCTISPVSSSNPNGLNNAGDQSYAARTPVNLAADDESPKTSLPPVVGLPEGGVQTFNVPANDAGGETLRYRLTTAAESCGGCFDPHPPGLTINGSTGQVTWDTTNRGGLWYSGVVVEALNQAGAVVSSTQVNYIIRVGGAPGNQAPVWDQPTPPDGSEFTVAAGQTLTFMLQASDPDQNDTVSILKNAGPGSLSSSDGNPATATYSYTPSSADVGTSQIVQFIAQDNGSPPQSPPFRSYTINVVAAPTNGGETPPPPPPATLTLTPPDATRTVGESHTVMAHAENGSGTVRFFVNGAHSISGTTPTNAAGDALFSYPSSTTGGDRIFAYLDLNGNGVQNSNEPGASATVSWNPQQQQPQENGLPPDIPTADSIDDLPNPQPYKTANIEPRGGGEVYVQLPDGAGATASQAEGAPRGFIPLKTAAQVPLGTVIDTSKGRVVVESTATNSSRRVQGAEFFSGRFQMVQRALNSRRSQPVTEMVLKGGSRRGCPSTRRVKAAGGPEADSSARRRSSRSRVRRLWGRGKGRFRTRGRYSSATVRGTTWLVEDQCGATVTRLPRRPRDGRVDVRDFTNRKTIRLGAGDRYVAKAPTPRRKR